MIRELYVEIERNFYNEKYYKVVKLVNKALQIPEFGFDSKLLYEFGYSLLRTHQIEEGIIVFRIITKLDSNPDMLKKVSKFIRKWEKQQAISIPLDEYLKKGFKLKEGLVVYLDNLDDFESEFNAQENSITFPYMIWKIENNRVYAFPVIKKNRYGYKLKYYRYFKRVDLAAKPVLVSFSPSSISKIEMELDSYDYNRTIQDLYERFCVFGTSDNKPKNYFVTEIEKSLLIEVGDIITVFDPEDKYRRYYWIVGIDEESKNYKGIKITHNNGNLALKDSIIEEISSQAYIMERVVVSKENQERLKEELSNLEESSIKR